MNAAQRTRAFLVAALLLGSVGAILVIRAAGDRGDGSADSGPATTEVREPNAEPPSVPAVEATTTRRGSERPSRSRTAAGESDRAAEAEPAAGASREERRAARAAVPIARRFLAAFSMYEIGRVSPTVRRDLEAVATRNFAAELLAAPPRLPRGEAAPPRARLTGELEFVPLGSDPARRRFRTAELVGTLARDGRRSSIAILLHRSAAGWRVAGLGR